MTAIVTKRLILSDDQTLATSNLRKMVRWLNDPDTMRYSEQRHRKHDEESQEHYIMDGPDIFRRILAGDSFIGTISAYIDKNNSVANVGILIGEKKEWGKGYGTEAWQAFCDHLLGPEHRIRKIEAGTMSCNFGMIHIFKKTGMHQEGRRSGHFLLSGPDTEVDEVQYARFI